MYLYGDLQVYNGNTSGSALGGYIGYGQGHNGAQNTQGIHMYRGSNGNIISEVIVSDFGARMSCGNTSFYVDGNSADVQGALNVSGNTIIGSYGGLPANLTVFGDLYVSGTMSFTSLQCQNLYLTGGAFKPDGYGGWTQVL